MQLRLQVTLKNTALNFNVVCGSQQHMQRALIIIESTGVCTVLGSVSPSLMFYNNLNMELYKLCQIRDWF
jgi:hypothetical protein